MTPFDDSPEINLPKFKEWIEQFMKGGDTPKVVYIGPKAYRAIMQYAGTPLIPETGIAYVSTN